jgi:hypothetical protein
MTQPGTVTALKTLRDGGYRVPWALTTNASEAERRAFVATWSTGLAGADDDLLTQAARRWVRTMREFPTLAEFRELVQSLARATAAPAPALPEATGTGALPSTAAQRRHHLARVRQQLDETGPLFHREDGSTVDPVTR